MCYNNCRKAIVIMNSICVSNFYTCFAKNIARVSGGYVMFLRSPPSRTNNVRRLRRNVGVHHEVERRQDRGEKPNRITATWPDESSRGALE